MSSTSVRWSVLLLGVVAGANLPACGPVEGERLVEARPLLGGASDTEHKGVVAFVWKGRNIVTPSATLVGPRTVVTAGHFLAELKQDNLPLDAFALFVGDVYTPGAPLIPLAGATLHPDFTMDAQRTETTNDIAVVELAQDVDIPPVPYNVDPDAVPVGTPVVAVGYGLTSDSPETGGGTRRQLSQTLTKQSDVLLTSLAKSGSPCPGDSGGALLADIGGRPTLVGVIVAGWCAAGTEAYSTRIDHFACFIATASRSPLPVKVSFVTPAPGSTPQGAFEATVETTFRAAPVDKVEFLLDGASVGTATSAPFRVSIDSLGPGEHRLVARASSGTCGQGEASITVVGSSGSSDAGPTAATSPDPGGGCSVGGREGGTAWFLIGCCLAFVALAGGARRCSGALASRGSLESATAAPGGQLTTHCVTQAVASACCSQRSWKDHPVLNRSTSWWLTARGSAPAPPPRDRRPRGCTSPQRGAGARGSRRGSSPGPGSGRRGGAGGRLGAVSGRLSVPERRAPCAEDHQRA